VAELVVLDVGHGSSALVIGERVLVIDAGPGSALLEYLDQHDIDEIEAIYISHADTDHIRGVIALLGSGRVSIGSVTLNGDAEKGSETWRDLVYDLDDYRRRGSLKFDVGLTEGHLCPTVATGVEVAVVAPRPRLAALAPGGTDRDGLPVTTNSISAVFRISTPDGPQALLTGDLDMTGLAHVLDAGLDLSAPVLVFPHHGGHCSRGARTTDDVDFAVRLMDAVTPSFVALSLGRGRHGTPRPEILDVIRRFQSEPRISCTQLSERCSPTVPESDPTHLTDRYAAGRRSRKCCAGTIVVPLGSPVSAILPLRAEHESFVELRAPASLCRDH
jgi:beta-lactamase superfamily II metal-dependent hydrolase